MSLCSAFVTVVGAAEVIGILVGEKKTISKKSFTVAGYLIAGFIQMVLAIVVYMATVLLIGGLF